MDALELVRTLRPRLTDAVIATDFDGTLAPLVLDPEQSRPVAGTVEALTALAGLGAHVAVVTGRDVRTVLRLGGLESVPGLTVEGVYGAETWNDGTLTTSDTPASIETLRLELPAAIDGADPAVWIEDKRLSLVVHTRQTADPAAERERLAPAVTALGERLGLEVHRGSDVIEVRLPGFDKAGAIRRLAEGRGAVLYLGDDIGDVPAFGEIQRLRGLGVAALGVAVASSGVPEVLEVADAVVDDPDAVVRLFRALAD